MPACSAGHESSATDFCDVCGMRIGGQQPGSAPSSAGGAASGQAEPCPQCGADRAGLFCEVCGFDFTTGTPSRPIASAGPAAPVPASASPTPASAGPAAPVPASASPTPAPAAAVSPSGPVRAGASLNPDQEAGPEAGAARAPGAGPGWTAVVTADRAYFDRVVAAGGPDAAAMEFPRYCPERQFRLSGSEMRVGRRSVSRGLEPEVDLTGPPTDPGVSHLHAVLIAQPDGTWSVLDPGSSNGTQLNGEDIATGEPVPLSDGDRVYVGAWTALTIRASAVVSQP